MCQKPNAFDPCRPPAAMRWTLTRRAHHRLFESGRRVLVPSGYRITVIPQELYQIERIAPPAALALLMLPTHARLGVRVEAGLRLEMCALPVASVFVDIFCGGKRWSLYQPVIYRGDETQCRAWLAALTHHTWLDRMSQAYAIVIDRAIREVVRGLDLCSKMGLLAGRFDPLRIQRLREEWLHESSQTPTTARGP